MIKLPTKKYSKPGIYSIKISNVQTVPQLNVDYSLLPGNNLTEDSILLYNSALNTNKNVISIASFFDLKDAQISINGEIIDILNKTSIIKDVSDKNSETLEVRFKNIKQIKVNDYLGRDNEPLAKSKFFIQGNLNLKRAIINTDSLYKLDDYCFFCCQDLEELEFYSNKRKNYNFNIGKYCFANCTKLGFSSDSTRPSIVFPDGLRSIDDYAFYNCRELKVVKLPSSIKYIGKGAFGNCLKLAYVVFNGKTKEEIQSMPNYGQWFNYLDNVVIIPGMYAQKQNNFKDYQDRYTFQRDTLLLENMTKAKAN